MMIVKDYQAKCQKGEINQDAEQLWVLEHLEEISLRLKREHKKRSRILSSFRKRQSITGLYLWGGVGIGKTFLMDCFFQHLPFKQKLRMHFHAFMQMVHHELKSLQGREDPLRILAEKIARANIVLCFDELAVSDITDAMILGRLFKILFANGVTLITTSNIKPDDLYKNGLQRQHFLSVIKMLKEHMRVMHLATKMDYRKRHLKQAGVFHTPNNEISLQKMEKTFEI
ncbi:MAG TPA: cell division protein ZapE, partial [Gammaproteobacteria bacterium]|nr:cell division protein ZapE [Gammaproteobacteria bacterium]